MASTRAKTEKKTSAAEKAALSDGEKAALKERAAELKAEALRAKAKDKRAAGEKDLLAKVAEMPPEDRAIAERLHEIVNEVAPHLMPKTMYGMPAYADEDGKVIVFFQAAAKWGTRYASLAFEERAKLDEGDMWPTGFAIKRLTPAVEEKITELVRRAVG